MHEALLDAALTAAQAAVAERRPLDTEVAHALGAVAAEIGWAQIDSSLGRANPETLRTLAAAIERSTLQWTLDSEDDVVIIRNGDEIGYLSGSTPYVRLALIALLPADRRLP